jgi:hypothetical protein
MGNADDDASDRRRAARIPINAGFATMPSATYISDLSEYGVFVHTPSPSPRGSKLKLRFTVLLDDPVIVEGEGRVVRQQYEPVPGMGIEFTELSPEMILRINDVVSRQRPRDLGPPLARRDDGEPGFDAADTLRSDRAAASTDAAAGGLFRPPPRPGPADENAKTSLYRALNVELDDPDSEQ